ncbi:MAG: NAD(P)/FAD-dependent oxidoreductase [Phycisphaerales bacterium]
MEESAQHIAQYPVVIVGGGLSGLSCAKQLSMLGIDCMVLDRGRRVGGRVSTKEFSCGEHTCQIDHGAPEIDVHDDEFREIADAWVHSGVAAWNGDSSLHGTPNMQSIAASLARGIRVKNSTEAIRLTREETSWLLETKIHGTATTGNVKADSIVFACPPVQGKRIATRSELAYPDMLDQASHIPMWNYIMSAQTQFPSDIDSQVNHDVLQSVRVRAVGQSLISIVATMQIELAAEHASASEEDQVQLLSQATTDVLDRQHGIKIDEAQVLMQHAQRWGLARPINRVRSDCLWQPERMLGFAGDAFSGTDGAWGEGEGAFLSGKRLAEQIAATVLA